MQSCHHIAARRSLPQRASLWRAQRAVAAVEFAMMAPVLMILFIGIIDCAQAFLVEMKLASAVAAGAQYVVDNATSVSSANGAGLASSAAGIVGNINGNGWASGTVVINNGPTSTFSGGTASPSGTASNADSCYCLSGSPGSWAWGSAATCGSACTTSVAGKFVTITASRTLTPFFSHFFVLPRSVTQNIVVEVQ
jgi:Flp pilus assembly protein TadG